MRSYVLAARHAFCVAMFAGMSVAGCTSPTSPQAASRVLARAVGPQGTPGIHSVFIDFDPALLPANHPEVLRGLGVSFLHRMRIRNTLAVIMPGERISELAGLPWVTGWRISGDNARPAADQIPWGISNTGADLVHSLTGNLGTHVRVGFIDTGVDCTQPDLSARVVGGFDFVNQSSNYCNFYQAFNSDGYHGTSVAGVIAASENGLGVVGMAPLADLYSYWVCDAQCLGARIVAAFDSAITQHVQVINLSLATCGSGTLTVDERSAVAAAQAAGIIVVAAAGNGECGSGDSLSAYARLPNVIAVTAMQADFTTVPGYQYGPQVSLAAPTNVITDSLGASLGFFNGTSAATPHVTGAVALLIAAGHTTYADVYNRLTTEAVDRGAPGKDNFYGYGSLDALAAVVPEPRATGVSGCPSPITTAGTCTLTASLANGVGPFLYKFNVSYSNGVLPTDSTSFGANSYILHAPAGSYLITVTVTPKENGVRTRMGFPGIFNIPVCTGGGGQQVAALNGTGAHPNTVGGCN